MDGKRGRKKGRVGGRAEMEYVHRSCAIIVSKIQERVMTQGGGIR